MAISRRMIFFRDSIVLTRTAIAGLFFGDCCCCCCDCCCCATNSVGIPFNNDDDGNINGPTVPFLPILLLLPLFLAHLLSCVPLLVCPLSSDDVPSSSLCASSSSSSWSSSSFSPPVSPIFCCPSASSIICCCCCSFSSSSSFFLIVPLCCSSNEMPKRLVVLLRLLDVSLPLLLPVVVTDLPIT